MSIKKSYLEQKWYYRVVRVFFLILPLLIALVILLNGKITICGVLQKNILDFLQKYLVYIVIGLALYYLILKGIWRGLLYIVFGGLEDDTKKKDSEQSAPARPKPAKIIQLIPVIIILGVVAIFILSEMGYITLPKIDLDFFRHLNVGPTPGPTCFTTSAQMGTPCHSVQNGVETYGVIVPDRCRCPEDTNYAGMDNVSPGGPYKMCTCR